MSSAYRDEISRAGDADAQVRGWTRFLEGSYARRRGVGLSEARRPLARYLGVAPGAVERLRAGRVKGVRVHLYDRVRALFLAAVQDEIAALEHARDLARQCGADPRGGELGAIEAHLVAARALLGA